MNGLRWTAAPRRRYLGLMITNPALRNLFAPVTTANVADACVRFGVPLGIAPPSVRPLFAEARCCGLALPVTHFGSVDVFLEALDGGAPGDVLVIDNQNRQDEGCIGDLTVIEAATAGVAGVVVWGAHRDAAELLEIRLPVFSTCSVPAGPRGVRPRTTPPLAPCRVGEAVVSREHAVFADADGVLFVPAADAEAVLKGAAAIATTERRQAERVRAGTTLRAQLRWEEYIAARRTRPELTFREHLATVGGAIET